MFMILVLLSLSRRSSNCLQCVCISARPLFYVPCAKHYSAAIQHQDKAVVLLAGLLTVLVSVGTKTAGGSLAYSLTLSDQTMPTANQGIPTLLCSSV